MASINIPVKLNVGGTIFETIAKTLVDEAYLGSEYFSQLLKQQPVNGFYFIDRDPDYFRVILNLGRTGEVAVGNLDPLVLEKEARFFVLNSKSLNAITSCREAANRQKRAFFVCNRNEEKTNFSVQLSVQTFDEASVAFISHHTCIQKTISTGFFGGSSYYLSCASDSSCLSPLDVVNTHVSCIKCSRQVDIRKGDEKSLITGWCHRCQRCLICMDTFCIVSLPPKKPTTNKMLE